MVPQRVVGSAVRGALLLLHAVGVGIALVRAQDGEDEDDEDDGKAVAKKSSSSSSGKKGGGKSGEDDAASGGGDDAGDALLASSSKPWFSPDDYGYWAVVLVLVVANVLLLQAVLAASRATASTHPKRQQQQRQLQQREFLSVLTLCLCGDWMFSPYVYKLYSFYGLSKGEIGFLFVLGYFAFATTGVVCASLADRLGRKRACIFYTVCVVVSCAFCHSTNFAVLAVGRVLMGTANAILRATSDAYFVTQHCSDGLPEDGLVDTLSFASWLTFAVPLGMLAASSFLSQRFGFVAPFDVSVVASALALPVIVLRWRENYGEKNGGFALGVFSRGAVILVTNPRVWLVGFIQCCTLSASSLVMLTWIPLLESTSAGENMPHSVIHAYFFLCSMAGCLASHRYFVVVPSSLAGSTTTTTAAATTTTRTYEDVAWMACLVSGAAWFLACNAASSPNSSNRVVIVLLCLFSLAQGVLAQCLSLQRARYVPNEVRSTIAAFVGIPYALVVVLCILSGSSAGVFKMGVYACALMLMACVAERVLRSQAPAGEDAKAWLKEKSRDEASSSTPSVQ